LTHPPAHYHDPDPGSRRFDVVIAGEINLDLILYGLPEKMPVERELLASGFQATLGSSSAILAHNLAVLGTSVGFITCLGDDPLGAIAISRLAESGVDLTRIVHSRTRTSTGVTVLLPHGRTRHILTYPGTMAELTCDDLDFEYLSSGRHFHLSSLFLQTGLHAGLPALLKKLKLRGLTISLDTNDDPADQWGGILDEILPMIDVLLPNEDELLRMARANSLEQALTTMGAMVPLIAVKRGARGTLVFERGVQTDVAPIMVEPVDTIGAGDSFNTGFLAAYVSGRSPASCAAAGNITGALSTLRPGGTEAFRDQQLREAFLSEHGATLRLAGEDA
jgi:sugar/nucleoside kinase (ribokinase family)